MRSHLVPCLVLCLLSPCLLAQGLPTLSGTWRFAGIETETFGSECTPSVPMHIEFEYGAVTFRPDGTGSATDTAIDMCPGATPPCNTTSYSGSIRYAVTPDGHVLLYENPGASGQEMNLDTLRSDASVLMDSRSSDEQDEPHLWFAVALSRGQSAASLADTYGFVRFVLRNDAAAQTMRSDYGTLTFDGTGGFTETSDRHQVTWSNTPPSPSTPVTAFSGNGTYAVAADGTVTIGGGGQGALSPDREFVFWTRYACPEVEVLVAVRLPQTGGTTYVNGDWRLCSTEVDVSTNALDSDWGTISLSAPGPSGGTLTPDLLRVSTISTSFGTTTSDPTVLNDSFTLGAGGAITLFSQGAQRRPVPGWVSRDGSILIGAPSMPTGASVSPGVGLTLGLTRCAMPTRVGAGTPGTAGIAPMLFSIGGFPHVGNADFGFVTATGLGGAPGALLLSGGVLPSAMPLLGFDLWIDPALFVTSLPVVLSGPAGAPGVGTAGMPLPLPPTPTLAGAILATQALVLDPGAPQGLSASDALDVRVSR